MSLQKQVASARNNSSPPLTDEPPPGFEGIAIVLVLPLVDTRASCETPELLIDAVIFIRAIYPNAFFHSFGIKIFLDRNGFTTLSTKAAGINDLMIAFILDDHDV